jgi:tetratricopeptide (TPR) repeat protein
LKEYGNVQPAYLCTKKAVELNPTDWDAWYDLGDLCQSVGRRDEAREAFQKYFDTHPDDAEIEHLLIALKDEAPPARASDRTIQQITRTSPGTMKPACESTSNIRGRSVWRMPFAQLSRNLPILSSWISVAGPDLPE